MNYLTSVTTLLTAFSTLAYSQTLYPIAMPSGPGRIAISHDGNNWDEDETYAFAMDYALIAAYGLQDKLVHVEHSTIWVNDEAYHGEMRISAEGANKFPGFRTNQQFDYQIPEQVIAGRANFKAEAEKSSATELLYFLLAGPMDNPYHEIEAVAKPFRKFIVCVSHSNANEKMGVGMGKKGWADIIKDFTPDGIIFRKIPDHSSVLGGIGSSKWDFLTSMPASSLMPPSACAWLRGRDFKGNGDISDNKMVFYAITGNAYATVGDYEARFKAPLAPSATGIATQIAPNFLGNTMVLSFSPDNTILKVRVTGMEGKAMLSLHNLSGQKIASVPMQNGHGQFNIAAAPKGKYFVDIQANGNNQTPLASNPPVSIFMK